MENCFYGPQSKSNLVVISACQSPMYLGLGPLIQGDLSRSIQFLHLDQAGCDYFVCHLVHISSSRFFKSQIGMERTFPLTKYLFKPVCFRKRFIHYLILLLHSSVVVPMIVINRHHRSFRITEG